MAIIKIYNIGVMRVIAPNGTNITPNGARNRALLAVISMSPGKLAARRWLEKLFWGGREQEQSSGSLRQALSAIRRSLGEYSSILIADRLEVSLDRSQVKVDIDDVPRVLESFLTHNSELLADINIRSNLFNDWLRCERNRIRLLTNNASPIISSGKITNANSKGLSVQSRLVGEVGTTPILATELHFLEHGLDSFIAESIRSQLRLTAVEFAHLSVITRDVEQGSAVVAPGSLCSIHVTQNAGRMMVLLKLSRVPSGQLYWSRQVSFDAPDEMAAIDAAASLTLEATEAVAACAKDASEPELANSMANEALREVFSFDPVRLKRADVLLEQANLLDPLASRPALRALAKAFLMIEHSFGDIEPIQREVELLINESLRLDPNNSIALAFIGDVHDLVFQDTHLALSYANRSLQLNPGSGYAHASLGALELRRGQGDKALVSASRARRQLNNTSLQVFSQMRFCVAAMHNGDFSAALGAAETAAYFAPTSRPPLRHLYALRLRANDQDGAREALALLRKLEPDFSLSKVREVLEYPASVIRFSGLDKLQDVEY